MGFRKGFPKRLFAGERADSEDPGDASGYVRLDADNHANASGDASGYVRLDADNHANASGDASGYVRLDADNLTSAVPLVDSPMDYSEQKRATINGTEKSTRNPW